MTKPFYAEPILNSPYTVPTRHHALSESGEPLDHPPIEGRRRSEYVAPVPRSRRTKNQLKKSRIADGADEFELDGVVSTEKQLLYVAATRARDQLFISAVAPGSEYLDDLVLS